ncbi:MAG: DUF6089 family protein [Ginsengibacter sp.]
MKNPWLSLLVIFFYTPSFAQKYQFELNAGIMNYQGDLQPHVFTFKQSRPDIGAFLKYQVSGHFTARAGVSIGSLYADDKFNRNYLQSRNLNFRTKLSEVQVGLECYLVNIREHKFSPYLSFGIAVFHFNNYTYDQAGTKVYLNPLSTEGEGLPGYPDRKKYKLRQVAIPFGEGFLYKISCNLNISAEFSQRKLFTDYLDDVSTTFIDQAVLLRERGPKAVEISYRADEIGGSPVYPPDGEGRGNPKQHDWYYTTTLKLSIGLVDCTTGKFILSGLFGNRNGGSADMRCPHKF